MTYITVVVLGEDVSAEPDMVDEAVLAKAVNAALAAVDDSGDAPPYGLPPNDAELSIRVTTDDEIQRLNREYRGVDRPTDILSFSPETGDNIQAAAPPDMVRLLGDVVLSLPTARRQAEELGHSLDMEMAWLTIHGTLQLLGYAHETDEEATHMEALERTALRRMGFTVQS